jgi:hypothetical protein
MALVYIEVILLILQANSTETTPHVPHDQTWLLFLVTLGPKYEGPRGSEVLLCSCNGVFDDTSTVGQEKATVLSSVHVQRVSLDSYSNTSQYITT